MKPQHISRLHPSFEARRTGCSKVPTKPHSRVETRLTLEHSKKNLFSRKKIFLFSRSKVALGAARCGGGTPAQTVEHADPRVRAHPRVHVCRQGSLLTRPLVLGLVGGRGKQPRLGVALLTLVVQVVHNSIVSFEGLRMRAARLRTIGLEPFMVGR